MASYNELNALIDAYINRNGVQAITGQILNGVLKAMVEQLGRGYTIMGAAIPTTDPGTPDGPECYFASETGTYTDFDGLQVAPGELALLCYTPTDGWIKNTIYEGFQEVGATIDGNVGTPSVGVSYANGVLSFDFHNMKGNTGDPAGFGTIGATVDGNIGTPGVTVSESGPNTAKNLTFAFTNLKGETGVTSVVATVDNTSGTPSCAVSLHGQQLTLAFTGLKGAQGDTGSSVDYPFTIVNNLTTDDATQALSAAQGVVLDGKVTQLEAETIVFAQYPSPSGSMIIPELKLNRKYFLAFTVSSSVTMAITLRKANGSGGAISQTIAESTTYAPGNYLIPFVFSDSTGIYLRLGESGGWSSITNIVLYYNLGDSVKDINGKVDALSEIVPVSERTPAPFFLETNSTFSIVGTKSGYFIPVRGGGSFSVTGTASRPCVYAFLKSVPTYSGQSADYATGASRKNITNSRTDSGTIPSDALYMYISNNNGSTSWLPVFVKINGYEYLGGINGVATEMNQLKDSMKDNFIVGNDNEDVQLSLTSFIPGHSYKLDFLDASWPISNITLDGGYMVIHMSALDSGGNVIEANLYSCTLANYPCKSSIDFIVPSGTKTILIGIRANAGSVVRFSVTDTTIIRQKGAFVSLVTNNVPAISTANRTLTIKRETAIIYNGTHYLVPYGSDVVVDLSTVQSAYKKVIFDFSNNTFSCKSYSAALTDSQGVLMLILTDYNELGEFTVVKDIACPFQVSLDGVLWYARQKDLDALEDSISSLINPVPSYFAENVASVVRDARRDMSVVGRNGENIIFITDMHWESNAKNSPAIVKEICGKLNIGNVVFGGDAINGEADQDTAMEMMADISGKLREGICQNFVAVMGNHDYNSADGGTAFSNGPAVFYSIFNKNMDNVARHGSDAYYYFDNPTSNTRFIVLESGSGYTISTAQANWLTQVLSDTYADMNIVVFVHTYLRERSQFEDGTFIGYDLELSNAGQTLQTAIDSAINGGKKVQCVIAGHTHLDFNGMTSEMVPVIGSDCDAKQSMQWPQTTGTKNEQSFDVITIDYTNKVIKCRRVGRGKSRIIHYDKNNLSVGGTLDISSSLEIVPTSYSIRDNLAVQYRNAAGGGTGVTYSSTHATISNAGVVTAVSAGLLMAVAENDDCIESFNIEVAS